MAMDDQAEGSMSSEELHAFLSSLVYSYRDTSCQCFESAVTRVGFASVGEELIRHSRYGMRYPVLTTDLLCAAISPQFLCPLCEKLMLDAKLLNPCGHHFCGTCVLARVFSSASPKCPSCHRSVTNSLPSRDMQQFLRKLRVKCPFSLTYDVCTNHFVAGGDEEDQRRDQDCEGDDLEEKKKKNETRFCSATVVLADLESHIRCCEYRPVPCSFQKQGCKEMVLSRWLALHERSCGFNVNSPLCAACGFRISADDTMESHLANNCLLPCPYATKDTEGCQERIRRADMEKHCETCPFRLPEVQHIIKSIISSHDQKEPPQTNDPAAGSSCFCTAARKTQRDHQKSKMGKDIQSEEGKTGNSVASLKGCLLWCFRCGNQSRTEVWAAKNSDEPKAKQN